MGRRDGLMDDVYKRGKAGPDLPQGMLAFRSRENQGCKLGCVASKLNDGGRGMRKGPKINQGWEEGAEG